MRIEYDISMMGKYAVADEMTLYILRGDAYVMNLTPILIGDSGTNEIGSGLFYY